VRYLEVVKLAPDMRPARSLLDPATFIKVMEPSIAVGLEDAVEGAKVFPWTLALPVRRVSEPDG
jgi:hypothetical protein